MNTNCLAGMRCPKCRSYEPFSIECKSIFTFSDEGEEDHDDVEWDDDSYCQCDSCKFEGKVKDFEKVHFKKSG